METVMPVQVVSGATVACTFGVAPSTLTVLPVNRVACSKMPAASIMDFAPMTNIAPFGMCISIANPQVAAATAAALGVLTPQPCIPATASPWVPGGPTVTIGGQPVLDNVSTCMCTWAGVISIVSPGQVQTTVP
jgi:Domain of unknown function (DUF4280)